MFPAPEWPSPAGSRSSNIRVLEGGCANAGCASALARFLSSWVASARHNGQMEDPTQEAAELRRTMYIAALWFAAALLSGTVTTAVLMSSGWRPYRLAVLPEVIWWTGTAVSCIGAVLLAWAGCPVARPGRAQENRNKALTVRIGVGSFLAGIGTASIVELCSPAIFG
jgi:hypothetical protein